jgi:hypothetical protein
MQETTGIESSAIMALLPLMLVLIIIILWKLPSIRRNLGSAAGALNDAKILQIDITRQAGLLWALRAVEHLFALGFASAAALSLGMMILQGVSLATIITFIVCAAIACGFFYYTGRICPGAWNIYLFFFFAILVLGTAYLFLIWKTWDINQPSLAANAVGLVYLILCSGVGAACVLMVDRTRIATLDVSVGGLVTRLRSHIRQETFPHQALKSVSRRRGAFFAILAAVLFVGAGVLAANSPEAEQQGKVVYYLLFPAYICAQQARRYLQLDANTLIAVDRRPPILFLRPFDDDNLQTTNSPSKAILDYSLEARLSQHFFLFGPFLAITDPRDTVPQIGASRIRLSDDKWQRAVLALVGAASVIIVYLGKSKWITWELAQLIDNQRITSVILVMPEVRRMGAAGRWQELSERAARMRSSFRDTVWADQINEIWDFSALRALVLKPDGNIVLIQTRSTSRESYHLSVLIAHALLLESTNAQVELAES